MSDTAKIKRPGAGRTKGSSSFVKIPLKDLISKFADLNTQIVVSRKYAEVVGFDNLTSNAATKIMGSIAGEQQLTTVEIKEISLD